MVQAVTVLRPYLSWCDLTKVCPPPASSPSLHPSPTFHLLHIHRGNRTTNGPPVVWAFNSTLNGVWQPVTSAGTFRATFAFNPSDIIAWGNISHLDVSNTLYFNVHTTKWPGGEIRGQFSYLDLKKKSKALKRSAEGEAACFPSHASVEVEGKGATRMDQLQYGDKAG